MSIDRSELQESAARLFEGAGLVPERQKHWDLIVEMGWPGLTVPEELGGLGLGRGDLYTLYIELGRVLAPLPFLPVMLAVEAISGSTDMADQQGWIDRLIGGEIITASLLGQTVRATAGSSGGYTLSGSLSAVLDADEASHILICADGEQLCGLLPLGQSGVTVTARPTWDESRRLFDIQLDNVALDASLVLSRGENAQRMADSLNEHLQFALAADSIGGASAMLDMTIEYLQTRRQFGRPLALFQALKHRCADLRTILTAAEALFWRYADGGKGLPMDELTQAGAIKSHAANAYHTVTEEAVQLHGGIGLTSEHPCHLFLKRALLNDTLGGTSDAWEARAGAQALHALATS